MAISTCTALTYFYKSLWPNESMTEWHVDKDTNQWYVLLNTQYSANNSLLYAAMVSPLVHPWFHSSWLDLKRPRQQLVRSLSQPVHWHSKTCTNYMYCALRHWDCHLVNTTRVLWDMWVVVHSIPFLNTQSSIWRQFFYWHGSCCWGLRKQSIWSLRALTFIQESICSISHSVAL